MRVELGLEREMGGGLNVIEKIIHVYENTIMKPNIIYSQYTLTRDIKSHTKQTDEDRLWRLVRLQ